MILPASGCKGRKVRAELITFTRMIEETRSAGDNVVNEFLDLDINFQHAEKAPIIQAQLDDLIKRINTLIAPAKALKLETEDIRSLRDNYLTTWESFRDALDLVSRYLKTKDIKLGMTMQEQLKARMAAYEQSVRAFESSYKELMDKYGVTREDLGIAPPTIPITPLPFTPSPQPSPFTH